ncbi:MAG: hypothetical protein A3I75_07155 [Deltaproteobacteria bacterium RIFCSPLOWO2_02_FULL_50_16]|nr:MAG: hypothetical protein A2053_07020 [Deltaproteobacteria bacterium GWA2_50_8]OGQ26574.1 MAG: hypothetical protein A3B79_01175 [Deltaproteobacteria bacterium RIFCSPHIGHO2_02_FULL_50_15]OGQ56811.1 MAG: hypothetical protein A3I75_07155 [Deltaproteobacteria bacterium RIFCSPLOWO2_02_FULL_50_16]OGQ68284.1 MAG: hypothetical protein A3F89_03985 [Deltaproteobacteria bacterium RIFCSPLOWO2_12_FULL_50_11]
MTPEELAAHLKTKGDIVIRPVFNPQEDLLVLQVSEKILLRGPLIFSDADAAADAPLAKALFEIQGVKTVTLREDQVQVTLKTLEDWTQAPSLIIERILGHLQSGIPAVLAPAYDKIPEKSGEVGPQHPLFQKIKDFLDNEVNPYVGTHGGHIDLLGIKDSVVFVKMTGGCQGCSSANATLRYGIEAQMKNKFPEITSLIDVTDHTGGANPFM